MVKFQRDSILRCSFNQKALSAQYASLTVSQFFAARKLARNLASVFGGTYTRGQDLPCMKVKQSSVQGSPMSTYVMRCEVAFEKWNQIVILLLSEDSKSPSSALIKHLMLLCTKKGDAENVIYFSEKRTDRALESQAF